ncbi:MAG: endonuclease [Dethiosulfovibrio peptidovorans]|nr:MAG: endonuclease [Dethiosulfovibrio peptidovorans]
MRIVLYNVRYGTGTGLSYHMPIPFVGTLRRSTRRFETIGHYLADLCPDLVGLVEVDSGSYRFKGKCQAKSAATTIGGVANFVVKYGGSLSGLPVLRSQGNAVISKQIPNKILRHDLGRGLKRAALEVRFSSHSFMLVHLSLGRASRRHQIAELARLCSERTQPLILAGDYNTLHGSQELSPLIDEGMTSVNQHGFPTFPCQRPHRELDFVLVSPEIGLQRLSIPQIQFSDHLPLVCDLHIPGEREKEAVP